MNNDPRPALDLPAYLGRIAYDGPLSPTLDVLTALHTRHAMTIPFENFDIHLGRPIRVDLESVQSKLVAGRRGGYCFEQNTLFGAVLQAIGFRVTTLAARVRLHSTQITPKTHMTLRVDLPEGPYIADVGFGGRGLTVPLRLVMDEPQTTPLDTFRLTREGNETVLQAVIEGEYKDLYVFTDEPHHPVDYEVANHYVSTYPGSIFVLGIMAHRPSPEGTTYSLRNREFTMRRAGTSERRELSDDEILDALRRHFSLDFEAGTRFRCLARGQGQEPGPKKETP